MNVGEYVRTKDGYIAKIEEEFDKSYLCDDTVEYIYEPLPFIPKDKLNKIIIKSSPNIIDLIEVGDYVNGIYIDTVEKEQKRVWYTSSYGDDDIVFYDNDIKSIVTKEQFESMEYKVGE